MLFSEKFRTMEPVEVFTCVCVGKKSQMQSPGLSEAGCFQERPSSCFLLFSNSNEWAGKTERCRCLECVTTASKGWCWEVPEECTVQASSRNLETFIGGDFMANENSEHEIAKVFFRIFFRKWWWIKQLLKRHSNNHFAASFVLLVLCMCLAHNYFANWCVKDEKIDDL